LKAKLIQVIQTESMRGKGEGESPLRRVTEYWSLEGELLAEFDIMYPVKELSPNQQKNFDEIDPLKSDHEREIE